MGELERTGRKLLADPEFAAALESRARDKRWRYSEEAYTSAFVTMVHELVRRDSSTVPFDSNSCPGDVLESTAYPFRIMY